MVIEGYVNPELSLAERINALGLMAIVNANTARIPQYASGTCQDPLEDEEAEREIASTKGLKMPWK